VYRVRKGQGRREYLLGSTLAEANRWADVESVAFCAIEPGRGADPMVPVYADPLSDGNTRLTTESPGPEAKPLFLGLAPNGPETANKAVVPLYEHRHAESGRRVYSTDKEPQAGWNREQEPLCRVWSTPPGPMLLDTQAGPARNE